MCIGEWMVTAKTGAIERVIDWIWQTAALRTLRRERPKFHERQLDYLDRCRSTLVLARFALASPASRDGSMVGAACKLVREATYGGLMAQRASSEAEAPCESLDALFKSANRNLLEHAAGDATQLAEIERTIANADFVDLAELPQAEQARLAQKLAAFAEALSSDIDSRELAIQRIWGRRIAAIATLVGLTLATIWFAGVLRQHTLASSDLARNRVWTTSSNSGSGCLSPDQACAPAIGFFFHTNEEQSPWLLIDLERPVRVSAVRSRNRTDCCRERGLPLVVELSTDQQTWKQVARQTSQFEDWEAKFPTTEARYVRLRAESKTILHLSQVRIYP